MDLIAEKLSQAATLVAASDLDVWLTFVRETAEGGDPALPFLIEGGMTWQSAFLVFRSGRRIAIVGNYDADPLFASGHWDEVVPYVQGIREPLLTVLSKETAGTNQSAPSEGAYRVGVNYSTDDVKADGLSHGMHLLLAEYLEGHPYELVSAAEVVGSLRALKTPTEIQRIEKAIEETEAIFGALPAQGLIGRSEREAYDLIQGWINQRGFGYGWDKAGNPIANSGPDSMIGHGVPSSEIRIGPGHIFHIDLGIVVEGYSSDIQRCWYVPKPGETELPRDVESAFAAVYGAISAGAAAMKPGVEGWQVDEAARSYLVGQGYEEYLHAFGHQVGRMAHDGGTVLAPRWERYGRTPFGKLRENEVYTLELGVTPPGRGYLGIEEIVVVTAAGIRWLSDRQESMQLLD